MLTEHETQILAFEGRRWKYTGAKEQAIREELDLSPTRYYQALNALIDRSDAEAVDVLLVRRLRRTRDARRAQRAASRLRVTRG